MDLLYGVVRPGGVEMNDFAGGSFRHSVIISWEEAGLPRSTCISGLLPHQRRCHVITVVAGWASHSQIFRSVVGAPHRQGATVVNFCTTFTPDFELRRKSAF